MQVEEAADGYCWVTYFAKVGCKENMYYVQDTRYTILIKDHVVMLPPQLQQCGRRFYYRYTTGVA